MEAILLDLLRVISHHRARLASPIRTVQKIYNDADLDGFPFADSVFTRGWAPTNRPLLLIEPIYKVKGDEKSKSQNTKSSAKSTSSKAGGKTGTANSNSKVKDTQSDVQTSNKTVSDEKDKKLNPDIISEKSTIEKSTSENSEQKVARFATMEEHIVPGVALDGSKTTSPIEEGMESGSGEVKELSKSMSTKGLEKDVKDGNTPGSTSNDKK